MSKKGFTLIELLAVIVILAILALISTPVILNIIEKARKKAFEDSIYGVLDAAQQYYVESYLDGKGKEEIFTFPEDTKLKLSGEKPKIGDLVLDEDGKVELALSNGKWCAIKNQDEEKITIVDYQIGECEIGVVPSTSASCFDVDESGDTITGYICEEKNVIIPSKINGIIIHKIRDYAFISKQLISVIIPDEITDVGYRAFAWNQLTNLMIPKGVINIEEGAFYNNQLTSVIIPRSLININAEVFERNQLTNVTIPEGVISIEDRAFSYNQLTSVIIPRSVEIIGNFSFGFNRSTKVIVNKVEDSITGSPWGASSVEWIG